MFVYIKRGNLRLCRVDLQLFIYLVNTQKVLGKSVIVYRMTPPDCYLHTSDINVIICEEK